MHIEAAHRHIVSHLGMRQFWGGRSRAEMTCNCTRLHKQHCGGKTWTEVRKSCSCKNFGDEGTAATHRGLSSIGFDTSFSARGTEEMSRRWSESAIPGICSRPSRACGLVVGGSRGKARERVTPSLCLSSKWTKIGVESNNVQSVEDWSSKTRRW